MSVVTYVSDMREWTLSDLPRGQEMKPLNVTVNWNDVPESVWPKIETLATLILTNIIALVEREEEVTLKVSANHRRAMFTVHVHPDDVGLAVGGQGRHADAVRTLLLAASRKVKFHFDLDIGQAGRDPDWSSD